MNMNQPAPPPPFANIQPRSLGLKFFALLLLALFMSLSGFFVEGLVTERADNHGVLAASAENSSEQSKTVLGIHLVDSYRSVRRSLHYVTLFLSLVFLTYFLFEATSSKTLHLAQYAMAGIAQIIFYLLLLSLAEHIGFDLSFLIASLATIGLFTVNTEWIFKSRQVTVRACATFSALYMFIYVLLRLENYALLVGAVSGFAAIACAMYLTRNLDWFGENKPPLATRTNSLVDTQESWLS